MVIENKPQTRRLAETTLGTSALLPSSGGGSSYIEEGPTCTGSGSQVGFTFRTSSADIADKYSVTICAFLFSKLENCKIGTRGNNVLLLEKISLLALETTKKMKNNEAGPKCLSVFIENIVQFTN